MPTKPPPFSPLPQFPTPLPHQPCKLLIEGRYVVVRGNSVLEHLTALVKRSFVITCLSIYVRLVKNFVSSCQLRDKPRFTARKLFAVYGGSCLARELYTT